MMLTSAFLAVVRGDGGSGRGELWGTPCAKIPAALAASGPAQAKVSLVENLRLDLGRKMLTWTYRRDVAQHGCRICTPFSALGTTTVPVPQEDGSYSCSFPSTLLHRGAVVTVAGRTSASRFEDIVVFNNTGMEGSAAVNFSCLIYHVRFMNCSWAPGPWAPRDVQYHLHVWFSRGGDSECDHYVLDEAGTHVGCCFKQLEEPQSSDQFFFLLRGASREAPVPFLDFGPFVAVTHERYDPPANVTVVYKGPRAVVRWSNPRRRYHLKPSTFYYELDIQRKGSAQKDPSIFLCGQESNEYRVPSTESRTEHTVRLRVRHLRGKLWSDWTQWLRFGTSEAGSSQLPTAKVLGAVGSFVLVAFGMAVVCRRYELKSRLFPPIPQVNRQLAQNLMDEQEVPPIAADLPPHMQETKDLVKVEVYQAAGGGYPSTPEC